jgi:ribosomal protein S18 acetylase RimI-like enzyme
MYPLSGVSHLDAQLEKVRTLVQAQELRVLRNECREFMTRDTAEISEEQQQDFFFSHLGGPVRAWLLRENSHAVAYGVLRDDGEHLWLSCGVTEHARGRGLGTAVVHLLTAAAGDTPVRLEVWQDNEPARHAYTRCGYRVTGITGRDGRVVELMEHP